MRVAETKLGSNELNRNDFNGTVEKMRFLSLDFYMNFFFTLECNLKMKIHYYYLFLLDIHLICKETLSSASSSCILSKIIYITFAEKK